MELLIVENYEDLSRIAADRIVAAIAAKPTAAVVLATGSSPMGAYQELAQRRKHGAFDATRLRVFQLDAYLGITPADRRSLYRWMAESFLVPQDVQEANVVRLPGDAPDPQGACRAYDAAVQAAGGFDLSVLGLGPNGHLGFNEPPADPHAPTRVIDLTEESIMSNARYWGGRDQVPRQAMTAGMAVLLEARQTLLLVSGAHKHAILHRAVEGAPSPEVPASFLQRAANVTIIADRAAWEGNPPA